MAHRTTCPNTWTPPMVIREFRGLIRYGFSTPEILLLQEMAGAAMLEPPPGRTAMESLPIIHALSGRMM